MRRSHGEDARGAVRLAVEATGSVVDVVEAMQQAICGGPWVLGRPLAGATRLFTSPVHGAVRGVSRAVGAALEAALAGATPLLGEATPGSRYEAALAVLNGIVGDHLAASGNPLAIDMCLRHAHRPLEASAAALRAAIPRPSAKLLVLVHGSCLCDRHWTRGAHDHGRALARDLGFTPIHVQYNTGLHVSRNGALLAALLERLVAAWPLPLSELVLLGHSMGGLVARSACHAGDAADHAWRRELTRLVCLGSPHHGAALERGGNWIDVALGVSRFSAPLARLGRLRSAGVTDLRFGNVLDAHWEGRDRFALGRDDRAGPALPAGVACYAIAATRTATPGAGRYASDGLVSVESALGRHRRPDLTLAFPLAHQWIALGTRHLDLLGSAAVYGVLRSWLSRDPGTRRARAARRPR